MHRVSATFCAALPPKLAAEQQNICSLAILYIDGSFTCQQDLILFQFHYLVAHILQQNVIQVNIKEGTTPDQSRIKFGLNLV